MNNLTKEKYWEWLISLTGACLITLGLGVILNNYLENYAFLIIIIGILLHSFGMLKVHGKK